MKENNIRDPSSRNKDVTPTRGAQIAEKTIGATRCLSLLVRHKSFGRAKGLGLTTKDQGTKLTKMIQKYSHDIYRTIAFLKK